MRIPRPRFAAYGAVLLLSLFVTARAASADPGTAAAADPGTAAAADHVITGEEIQSRLDQKVHSDEADRQAIRDLLSRPEVRHIAGSAGLSLERANAAVATLSGPELARLATQAREADSAIVGGKTVTMTWTMVIILVVALVVLISVL
ncbi:MAG: PA2779 family protein [Bacteroidota bacterium]